MSNIKPQSNDKLILQKFILDPLSTIIKLAVLGKKEIGCKIYIKNNQVHIQENGMFQGLARYYHGVTKNYIHFLSIPIELACKLYLTIEKIKEIPNIIIIFKCAQQGLNNLMGTYNLYPIIIHCLKYYYSIIDNYLHIISCEPNKASLDNIKTIDKNTLTDKSKTLLDAELNKKVKKPDNKHNIYKKISEDNINSRILSNDFISDTQDIIRQSNEYNNKEFITNKEDIITNKNNDELPIINELSEKPIDFSDNELLSLYSDDLLNKFNLIWDSSKIQIVIQMINYLLIEKSALEYSAYIETFMIPIDKEILNIIYY